jgi:hypothetical protein
MAFIGNTNTTQAFTPAVDFFSGDASTTAFTLSKPVASVAQVQAVVNNVAQNPSDAFTVSGNTITFTSAPSSGTNNIYVYYTSPITQVIAPGQGTVGPVQLDYATLNGTGATTLPSGTTAQRPGSPVNGMVRYNTTLNKLEAYQNSVWGQYDPSYSIDALVIGGGGGGGMGANAGGGGGAGGYQTNTFTLFANTSYTITVGTGGAGGTGGASGSTGGSSSFGSVFTSLGGGGGGGAGANGVSGGSGGGGGSTGNSVTYSGGAGTSGQGNAGGTGRHVSGQFEGGGGGGGAGAVGNNSATSTGGVGGAGLDWQSLGTFRGGGGGGSGNVNAAGGTGGGGAGTNTTPNNGTANTGGGGGGGQNVSAGSGGSGVVIIRYLGAQRGTGGTVTSAGGYTYHTFTSSGTYTA